MRSVRTSCSGYAADVTCQVCWSGRDFGICIRGQLKNSRADDRTGQEWQGVWCHTNSGTCEVFLGCRLLKVSHAQTSTSSQLSPHQQASSPKENKFCTLHFQTSLEVWARATAKKIVTGLILHRPAHLVWYNIFITCNQGKYLNAGVHLVWSSQHMNRMLFKDFSKIVHSAIILRNVFEDFQTLRRIGHCYVSLSGMQEIFSIWEEYII